MNDLNYFYSAKMAVVFFILMLASATLEAKRNEKDKFFDLMTAIGDYFGGEFNKAEKALELDLNGANSFLKELHKFATREIVTKNENGQFECKKSEKPTFIKAIKEILGEKSDKDVRNLLKAISVPKSFAKMPSKIVDSVKLSYDDVYNIKTLMDENSFKKVEDLVKGLSKKFSEEQLFNLLFSLGARLEALVHGKNIDGTLKENEENSKEKIQTFLAVPKCFEESELSSIFDYWIEIIEIKPKKSQEPIFGIAIYKEKCDKWGDIKQEAFELSRNNYKILKQLNDQKFSIYESSNFLRAAFNWGYSPTRRIPRGEIPKIFVNLLDQINNIFYLNWKTDEYWVKKYPCAYAMFFQNISESLMKNKMINAELHLDSEDKKIQEYVQKDVEESCKKFDNEAAKIIFLNNVHYDLAINFEFNQRKDVHDRVGDLLSEWVGDNWTMYELGLLQLTEESYLKKNASKMLNKIKHFTSEKTNREKISIIEALIGKEHFNQLNLVTLFDQIKTLVEVAIPEEEANLEKAKKEINTKQLENEIKFLKNNPKSIAEEKYQKAVAIICTIKQLGEKVEMLASKIKTFEIKEQLKKLSSNVQQYRADLGPKVWKQTEEFCNQLKHKQIDMEKIASGKILFSDLQFEIDEIWWSFEGGLKGIEAYYLSIPLMQHTERARTLAKSFGKMLQNVKEHYTKSIE